MKKENLFWGLFFIVGTVALIVNKLELLGGINLWTIFFTVFSAVILIKSMMHRSASGILFPIVFLCILYDKELGITALTPWMVLGVAALGSIGCPMLFQPRRKDHWEHHENEEFEMKTIEGGSIHPSISFAGSIKYIGSDDFIHTNLKCSLGTMKAYFDNAVIQSGQAVVALDVSFAGIELFVPKEWRVDNMVDAPLGGVEEKSRSISTGTPVLKLTGKCSFAGIAIIYV